MFTQNIARAVVALNLTSALVFSLISPVVPAYANHGGEHNNTPGNNGTLKVHEVGTPKGTEDNDPKVCAFNFEGFGFDQSQTGYILIATQGGSEPVGEDAGPFDFGPTDADGYAVSQDFNTTTGTVIKDGTYKATLYGKDTNGQIDLEDDKAKSKVFKVECDDETTPISPLQLTSQCILPNNEGARWFIKNNNDVEVDFTWNIYGTEVSGANTAPAAGQGAELPWAPDRGANYLFFDTPQAGTLVVQWLDENEATQQTTKASNETLCEEPVTGSISGYKWNDVNGDQSSVGEPKLSGWKIFLDENGNYTWDEDELFDVTDESGNYSFTDLPIADYTICEVMQEGWTQTFPDDTDNCHGAELTSESNNRPYKNFGNQVSLNPCDPSTYNGSVYDMIKETGAKCVDIQVKADVCGQFSATVSKNDTPYQGQYKVAYSLNELDWNTDTDASSVEFDEDEFGGSVKVYYWLVGPEADFITAQGLPWYMVEAASVVVDTNCEEDEPDYGDLVIGKAFCLSIPQIFFEDEVDYNISRYEGLERFEIPVNPMTSAGCDEELATDVTIKIYAGEGNEGDVVYEGTMANFEIFGTSELMTSVEANKTYTVCEEFDGDYESWVASMAMDRVLLKKSELLDSSELFTEGNCITITPGLGTTTVGFVNIPKVDDEEPETPVVDDEEDEDEQEDDGDVAADTDKQEQTPQVLGVSTLPSTGSGAVSMAHLIGLMVLTLIGFRKQLN